MTRAELRPGETPETHARPKSELAVRIVSAIVLLALALATTVYSLWSFLLLVIIGGAVISWEWTRLTRGRFDGIAVLSLVAVALISVTVAMGRFDYALLMFAAGAVTIGMSTVHRGAAFWPLAGFAYAALPAASLVWLRSDAALGALAVLFVFAVAWTTDTASYVAGRSIGGPKLAPRVSPNKTWSGFVVGAATPALVGVAFAAMVGETSAPILAFISVVLALACQGGDLIESAVKRHFGVKDASQLIPGHGGLLDRVDGLLAAAVVAAVIALRDPSSPGHGLLIW